MKTSASADMEALRAYATYPQAEDTLRALRVEKVPVPHPAPGQVLVRIRAAPCNPADLLYLTGRYGISRPLPATPGFEGAGVVVASGGGLVGRWLVGKRVACGGHTCSGTWAEYCVADATQCLPLLPQLSFEEGATALANPMTALALVQLVTTGRHKSFVQTASAGQLGRMILQIARGKGIPLLNVVRREEQAEALRAEGAEVLVSERADFEENLRRRAGELSATLALDAVSGPMTGTLLNALPPHSEVVIYGALSGQPSGTIEPMQMAFGGKRLRGFEIAAHLRHVGLWGAFKLGSTAQRWVSSAQIRTTVRKRVPLNEATPALIDYAREMSAGRVLLTPGAEKDAS